MLNKRKKLRETHRLLVWTEAAGRCQFRGCNKPLWMNELTLNQRNFGEFAHIIGASKDGPRGSALSKALESNPDNIMLMCDRCHKEIDDSIISDSYSVEDLQEMKKEHVERVRRLLDVPAKKTRPLIYTYSIMEQEPSFGDRSILKAILPDYPDVISGEWYKNYIKDLDTEAIEEWGGAERKLETYLNKVNHAVINESIDHLSIFSIGPMPLLMKLGFILGDKVTASVYEPIRTDDLDKKWQWEEESSDKKKLEFKSELIRSGSSHEVILLFAISDFIEEDKYKEMLGENTLKAHVYKLTVDEPVQGNITKKSEKDDFIRKSRFLLNKIQADVGVNCKIHVLPAMAASLAIEFGRLLQPTKDPEISVYQKLKTKYPEKVIDLFKT